MKEICLGSEKDLGTESGYSQKGTLKVQEEKCVIEGIFSYSAAATWEKGAGQGSWFAGQIPVLQGPDLAHRLYV